MPPTTVLLIRHAAHDRVGSVLWGRMPGVMLGERGRAQARALARRLGSCVAALQTSPLERCRETAAILAEDLCRTPEVAEAMTEIDFGAWVGRSFSELGPNAAWRRWNESRDEARAPGGESAREAQARALIHIASLRDRYAGETVAIVTHADIIKSVLAQVLGLPLQSWSRFEISPGSVSRVTMGQGGAVVLGMNEVPAA